MVWNIEDISNEELTEADIPWESVDWGKIGEFALTFDGYGHWGSFEKCADVGNESTDLWRAARVVPASLTELRTCLFFEQRRWRHYGYDPDADTFEYLKTVVRAIHDIVARREQASPASPS